MLAVQNLRPKVFLVLLLTTKPLMRINGSGLQDTNLADTYIKEGCMYLVSPVIVTVIVLLQCLSCIFGQN